MCSQHKSPKPELTRDQLADPDQAADAASQSQRSCTPQPDRRVGSFADGKEVSSSKKRRVVSDHTCSGGLPFIMQRGREWVYLVDGQGIVIDDWDAADVGKWRKHMPWGKSENEQFNTLLGKLVCTVGCARRVVASGAVRALAHMMHPRCVLESASTFARSIIPALTREAWSMQRLRNAKQSTSPSRPTHGRQPGVAACVPTWP